jgi:hypothetical protein
MVSITFFINFLMTNRVPLHNRGGFKLRAKKPEIQPSVINYAVACLVYPMSLKTHLNFGLAGTQLSTIDFFRNSIEHGCSQTIGTFFYAFFILLVYRARCVHITITK